MRLAIRLFLAFPIIALTAVFAQGDRPVGIPKRVPWTSSRITGSLETPPPYMTERLFPKLKFNQPVVISGAPGTERMFVVELPGKIYSFPNDPDCQVPDLFLDLGKIAGHWRTYGLTFHPDYAR